jgi:hypothetical protein
MPLPFKLPTFHPSSNAIKGRSGSQLNRTNWERAEMLWKVHGFPQIIISFGARGGGAEFALWLREQLMAQMGLRGTEVYIDTIGMLKEGYGETKLVPRGTETAGIFAAYNDAWKGYFEYAMYRARAMIFVVTQEWMASANCREEHGWFVKLNDYTPNAMRGISLVIDDDTLNSEGPAPVSALPLTQELRARRRWAVQDALQRRELTGNIKNLWTIDEDKLAMLLALL